MDELHRELAAKLRALMRRKRWSANQLADFAGLGRGFVSEVLAGKKSPTLRTLAKLAQALEVSPRDLVPDVPARNRQ